LTGGGRTGVAKKLVKEDESRTIGVSSIQGEDESDRPPPLDQKTMSLLSSQGDSRATLMGINGFDHETKVKARSERRNLQTASQLYTKQVGTGEINQRIESLLKVKVQRITKTY